MTMLMLAALAALCCAVVASAEGPQPLSFETKLDTVLKHDDGKFLWYHPRVAAIPGAGQEGMPAVVMTLQRHLHVSDHYSGVYFMRTDDLGRTWTAPELRPELDWQPESDKVDVAVCDVTPGWHPQSGKVLALGAQVRYSKTGEQLEDVPRARQTAYSVYDPQANTWTRWRRLEAPDGPLFNMAHNACAQWLVKPDGTLLVPMYHGLNNSTPSKVTVMQYSFDGDEPRLLRQGNTLSQDEVRGLAEPSLAFLAGRYYLTIRHDNCGYITVSDDGLNYAPTKRWTFDDGQDLGSYNTQQHWVSHSDGLFLVYTRRGANNDHMMRHRAPLFIARVDPEKLCVIRSTERLLIPERGGEMGNFGAAAVSPTESWVTVSEGIWSDDARRRGAEGATFVARVVWSTPNRQFP